MLTETLTGTTLTVGDGGLKYPMTITFRSAEATRKIELSTDGGIEFFQPILDVSTSTMQVVVVNAPLSRVKVTGAIGDTLHIEDN